jgi:uncharacterized repeat protein (TIGR01451 family)
MPHQEPLPTLCNSRPRQEFDRKGEPFLGRVAALLVLCSLSALFGCGGGSSYSGGNSNAGGGQSLTSAFKATVATQGNFSSGESNASYNITVSNSGNGPTSGTVTVADPPTGFTVTAISGTGWTCTLATTTCTRSDALAAGQSYPAITVTGNVTSANGTPVSIPITLSGGGTSSPVTVTPTPTITVAAPALSITKSHTNNFNQGQQGATYMVTVANGASAGATNAKVTVTETVPSGETLVSMSGTGWTCPGSGGANTCDRSDGLLTAASYPALTVTVNVAANAASPQVNQVSASGGGMTGSVSANDSTTLNLLPTVQLSASAGNAFVGQPVTLTWSSMNATSCTASGAWSGTEQTSGSASVVPSSSGSLTYTLTCAGSVGNGASSVSVTATTPSLSLTNSFSPNATTISTSEGAPYGDCDFWVSSPSSCDNEQNFGYGPTRVMRLYICLSGEVSVSSDCSEQPAVTGPLSQTMLDDMNTRLAAYQGTGMKVMIRFTYNFGPIGPTAMDPPLSVILNNLDQVAPIVLQYEDIVFAIEAGFIGTWGEWHDSTSGNDTAAAQQALLDKERSYFSGVFPILVRYPGDLIQYAGTTPQPDLGMHDDYYASSADDGGTWDTCDTGGGWCLSGDTASQFQSYAAAVSTTTMFVGEFGALYSPLQTCAALNNYSYTYHPQSIGITPYPQTIDTELQSEGCGSSFLNMVGTRIELQGATIIGNPTPNGQLFVALTLANTGFGRVIRARPATLVFSSGGNVVAQIPVALSDMDLRQLGSSSPPTPQAFQFTITLPATFPSSGQISMSLLIPDPAPSLTTQPAYALPLNSLDQSSNAIFAPATGYNLIAIFNAN